MVKVILDDIAAFTQAAIGTINSNNQRIEDGFDNTLSRDGMGPNQMEADLDMNHHDILNVATLQIQNLDYNGVDFDDLVEEMTELRDETIEYRDLAEVAADEAEEAKDIVLSTLSVIIDPQFSDKSSAESYSPEVAPDYIRLAGYTTAGDGGGATYKKVNTEPSHEGKLSITLDDTVTTVWYELSEIIVNPFMFGAIGDGLTDDREAIQNTVDFADEMGGQTVLFPAATFLVSSSTRDGILGCIHSSGRAHLVGMGLASVITPASSVDGGCNTIVVKPIDTESASGFTIRDLFLGNNTNGYRQGLHGIYLDTTEENCQLPGIRISNMYICQSRDGSDVNIGKAIAHVNDQDENINGGMYGAVIENNRGLGGGIYLYLSGDSNTIRTSIISGSNNTSISYRCIGVDATLCTSGGGAGFLVLEDLNITTEAGAYIIRIAKDICINRIYGEFLSSDAGIPIDSGRALAVIESTGNTIIGGSIRGGRLAAATGVSTSVTTNLYIANAKGLDIGGGLSLYPGKSSGGYGIELSSTSYDNTIRRLGHCPDIDSGNKIVDSGTRNLFNSYTDLSLNSPFSHNMGGASPKAMRSDTGIITLEGYLDSSSNPNGQVITTLPEGYRPPSTLLIPLASYNGAAAAGYCAIESSGNVTYIGDSSITILSLSCSFRVFDSLIFNA